MIKYDKGVEYQSEEDIARAASDYFNDLFTSIPSGNSDQYFQNIRRKVTHEINSELTKDITDEEIKNAAFSIGPDRTPGPDGMNRAFYQRYGGIIGTSVKKEVREFFILGRFDHTLNHTNIVLIPKNQDFHPISLCNVAYKIIYKVLVVRMQQVLTDVISDNQSAFVPGRNIGDNILIAHELVHALKVRKRQAKTYMAVKTDISKA